MPYEKEAATDDVAEKEGVLLLPRPDFFVERRALETAANFRTTFFFFD